jgi:Autographiviridae endonuclease VII
MEQEGRCAICGEPQDLLCVDHCHLTNEVRGLLCGACNVVLGYADKRPQILEKMADYLQREHKHE